MHEIVVPGTGPVKDDHPLKRFLSVLRPLVGEVKVLQGFRKKDMTFRGLDHLVVHTQDVLSMEKLRLDEFCGGKVSFVSALSAETIIDVRPGPSREILRPNVDHCCLVLGPTYMKMLHEGQRCEG